MKLELFTPLSGDGENEIKRDIGAVVTRATPTGLMMEMGPADGPPQLRLLLSLTEATKLGTILQRIANGGGEEILIASP